MHIDDRIHGISTLLNCMYHFGSSQGTGFFYQELGKADPAKGSQWLPIEKTYIVTNRHVILGKQGSQEIAPTFFTFHLRWQNGNQIEWEPITLDTSEMLQRAKFHQNPTVDIAVVDVLDLITEKMKDGKNYLQWHAVTKNDFPGNNKLNIDVSSGAVVIGYPRGFYDQVNKFPIVKSGIIASRYGLPFNGNPYFLIDSKLFPGSSGSIVISEPTNITVDNGSIFHNPEKQFAFLGVYSGEPFQQSQPIELDDMTIIRKSGFNVGIVWYAQLIEDIISSGVKLSI